MRRETLCCVSCYIWLKKTTVISVTGITQSCKNYSRTRHRVHAISQNRMWLRASIFRHFREKNQTNNISWWSSGQSFWLQIQRSRVHFPALPDFLRSRGYGTGSTQPCEENWRVTGMKKWRLRSRKPRLTAMGIRCANDATASTRKGWH
jgi:hypothetical protein